MIPMCQQALAQIAGEAASRSLAPVRAADSVYAAAMAGASFAPRAGAHPGRIEIFLLEADVRGPPPQ